MDYDLSRVWSPTGPEVGAVVEVFEGPGGKSGIILAGPDGATLHYGWVGSAAAKRVADWFGAAGLAQTIGRKVLRTPEGEFIPVPEV